jgi:endoglycosylceramidase
VPNVNAIADNALTYADAQGIPAFMTEVGAGSDQTAISASMQAADQHLIGWTEWAYSSQGDISTTASPPSSESLVYNPEDPPVGARPTAWAPSPAGSHTTISVPTVEFPDGYQVSVTGGEAL